MQILGYDGFDHPKFNRFMITYLARPSDFYERKTNNGPTSGSSKDMVLSRAKCQKTSFRNLARSCCRSGKIFVAD